LGLFKEVPHETPVSKRGAACSVSCRENLSGPLAGIVRKVVATVTHHCLEYLQQFVRAVIFKRNRSVETRGQTRIGSQEAAHFIRVSGDDNSEALALIFHLPQERLDRLAAKVALRPASQGIGLVDEKNSIKSAINYFMSFDRCPT
jgi:hypothetical protein